MRLKPIFSGVLNYLIIIACIFSVEGENNFTELSSVFLDLKVSDKFLDFEVLQKFDNDVVGVKFIVKFDFANSAHYVFFEGDNARRVVLISHV